MRLLWLILATVAVVFFLTRKSAAATASSAPVDYNSAPTPGELSDLQNYETQATDASAYTPPGVTFNLPGGLSFQYFGDPNQFPDITDQNGDPYALASGRNS